MDGICRLSACYRQKWFIYIASVYSLYLFVVPKLQLKFGSPFPIFCLIVHHFSLKISVFLIALFVFLQNIMSLNTHTYFFFFKLHETCYVLFAALFVGSPNPVSCLNATGFFCRMWWTSDETRHHWDYKLHGKVL